MRAIIGHGTPREAVAALRASLLLIIRPQCAAFLAVVVLKDDDRAGAVFVHAVIAPS